MSYLIGHIKRNPVSGEVALRTIFPDDEPALAGQAWLVATSNRGAYFAKTGELTDWDDLYTPEGS